jgi:DNA mismatch repair protein MutS
VIRQARSTLELLEAHQRQSDDQIDLFAQVEAPGLDLESLANRGGPLLADNAGEAMTAAEAQTLSLLAGIDPDTLTPREALDALYKLKSVISS